MASISRRLLWLLALALLCAGCNVSPIPVPLPHNKDSGMAGADQTVTADAGMDMPTLPDALVMKDAPGPVPDFGVWPDSGLADGAVPDVGAEDGAVGDGGVVKEGGAVEGGAVEGGAVEGGAVEAGEG